MATFKAKIDISDSAKVIDAFVKALTPEMKEGSERANYSMKTEKGKLIISIEASDATAFRAVMTTLTGLMAVTDMSAKIVKEEN